ncbi:hypothetical protein MJO28_004401 [Puccinia striiformis f. sp. tritici]|uniref:DUF1279 domain-containing protein n=2 Tax=Puccinia striiformis TaxID=27350 RepID=A0A2S4VCK7_9BASI|nr:hypothetical protein MJO28_004401 [Puccinia striiformis f. sp. tritici]POW07273.1 hypothetical protein PSTT_08341 [Puccinia striiformis]
MGNQNRAVLQLNQILLLSRNRKTQLNSIQSSTSSSQVLKKLSKPNTPFSTLKMAPAALFQKDSWNQKNYESHQIHREIPDASRLRPSKIHNPTVIPHPISASSNLTHSPLVDHHPKTTHSYHSIRSFFSKFTDLDHSHHQHKDEKSSNFRLEDQQASSPVGLFGKIKQLTKLYGSAALVVYGVLGGLDFGLSFIAIYLVGAEHVRTAEDWLLESLNWKRAHSTPLPSNTTTTTTTGTTEIDSSMLWTTAVVAYTIHKTILLPFRIGLTAWITPPIVRQLRKRGWKVGRNLG